MNNLPYRSGSLTSYEQERCKLDLVTPREGTGFPVIVWFHGGGIAWGSKDDPGEQAIARRFARAGVAMAVANYRLSPLVNYPAYVEDAAAAVAWVMAHIADYGGDSRNVFISGVSAGGYLAALIGTDPSYLARHHVALRDIPGVIPVSGQLFTHFTVRQEHGVPDPMHTPVIDDAAPCYHARHDVPPFLAICGDHDWPTRAEENRYFIALLQSIGHPDAVYREISDRDHGTIAGKMPEPDDPTTRVILEFVDSHRR